MSHFNLNGPWNTVGATGHVVSPDKLPPRSSGSGSGSGALGVKHQAVSNQGPPTPSGPAPVAPRNVIPPGQGPSDHLAAVTRERDELKSCIERLLGHSVTDWTYRALDEVLQRGISRATGEVSSDHLAAVTRERDELKSRLEGLLGYPLERLQELEAAKEQVEELKVQVDVLQRRLSPRALSDRRVMVMAVPNTDETGPLVRYILQFANGAFANLVGMPMEGKYDTRLELLSLEAAEAFGVLHGLNVVKTFKQQVLAADRELRLRFDDEAQMTAFIQAVNGSGLPFEIYRDGGTVHHQAVVTLHRKTPELDEFKPVYFLNYYGEFLRQDGELLRFDSPEKAEAWAKLNGYLYEDRA